MSPLTVVKAHAFGNDFILLDESALGPATNRPALARALCERHRGLGADGLIVYTPTPRGASMRLLNADGSRSEVSGNGVRCLAAWLADARGLGPGDAPVIVETEAGAKRLEVLAHDEGRWTFRAAMGAPEDIADVTLRVAGEDVRAVTLRVGNPQCVVLGEVSQLRLHTIAAALAVHTHFPEGTNVELAEVLSPGHVRVLIWERGVGPTEASGTGACAAAIAAMRHGGAAPAVEVESPGGVQRVEWVGGELFLTGWAEVILEARWLAAEGEGQHGW
ncbi:MAG: diaminopimelate epimerase [Acidobacteria bacterium]|nr:diaminopimelate epimerase [Acidobacteriota bacterium]MBA3886965.1 diaminopimelate epimerase [Acidobacteriota bacterium]